MNIIYYRT